MLGLDLRDPYWATHLYIFAQGFGCPLRHVFQEFLAQLLWRALERDDQRLGLDFFQQQLDAAVFEFEQVLEQEHFVHHFLRQHVVMLAHMLEHAFFLRATHHVDNLGRGPDTA